MKNETKCIHAKRVNIVSLKMVKENTVNYAKRVISSPDDSYYLLKEFLEDLDREAMILCCLDTKNQPNSLSIISIGSLSSAIIHPREVFKTAILSNSASILLAHSHPSGLPDPSHEDIILTNRLCDAGNILGIKLLDHLIIGENRIFSFKEEGLL